MLVAGTLTFTNEWYQTNTVNWRIPIATFGAAWLMAGIAEVSEKTATGLSFMVLIVALSTPFGGKSVLQEMADVLKGKGGPAPVKNPAYIPGITQRPPPGASIPADPTAIFPVIG